MRKLSVTGSEKAASIIQAEIGRSHDSRYTHRLHGVLFVAKGLDCYEVAELMGHSPTTIESWVHAYNDEGFAGLYDEVRPGRPSRISEEVMEKIGLDLRTNPREFGYSQTMWDGKLLSYHLERKYSLSIGVRQAQRLFHKLGFRQRKPRPVISRSDPIAQESFKKTQ
jgi:transposase